VEYGHKQEVRASFNVDVQAPHFPFFMGKWYGGWAIFT
jgi:hypothetical protein